MSRREDILEAATALFAAQGFHAVGMAQIVEASGVARAAIYDCFRSKEELILAVLRRRDETVRNLVMREVERSSSAPRARLLALFAFLEGWIAEPAFSGCMFINASAEFHRDDDPIHRMAAEHKRLMLSYIGRLCADAGAARPEALAEQLYLLFDGAIVQSHASGASAARMAATRAAAQTLIAAAIPDHPAGAGAG